MMSVDEIAENVVVLDFDLPDEVLTQIQEVSDEIYLLHYASYDMWPNWVRPHMRGYDARSSDRSTSGKVSF
jgi:hypothetical protein